MASYQININRKEWNQAVDMQALRAALSDLIEGYEQVDNQYGEEGEFVMVDNLSVGEAVRRITQLGYSTDEDELTPEEQAEIDRDSEIEQQAAELANAAADLEVQQRHRMGRPPVAEEERKEAQQVMLEREWIDEIEQIARERKMTKSAVMRDLIIQAIKAGPEDTTTYLVSILTDQHTPGEIKAFLMRHNDAYSHRIAEQYDLGITAEPGHGIWAKGINKAAHYQAWLTEMARDGLRGWTVVISKP